MAKDLGRWGLGFRFYFLGFRRLGLAVCMPRDADGRFKAGQCRCSGVQRLGWKASRLDVFGFSEYLRNCIEAIIIQGCFIPLHYPGSYALNPKPDTLNLEKSGSSQR